MIPKSSTQIRTLQAVMQAEEREASTSRLLSTVDSSLSNPSFRVYYGVASAGSVPFMWESTPGTPKNAIPDAALPPLTPPPSYYSAAKSAFAKKPSSKRGFVHGILPKLRRSYTMPTPSPPSSMKESGQYRRARFVASPRSSFSSTSRGEDEDMEGAPTSPTSTLCFRVRHGGAPAPAGRTHGQWPSAVGGRGSTAS